MSAVIRILTRKKRFNDSEVTQTQLARCLSTLDLTALGIGSTLGIGIYVVAGEVAREKAGPSVVLSFFIAAVASFFAGLCYAEFGARVPKTGSAYVYSYVTVGEFLAFIIGWNLILEYVIGTASVARGWTAYVDSLTGNALADFWNSTMPMNVRGLSPYPDFLALAITLTLTVVLAFGVKQSSMVNNVFTTVNLLVVLFVVVCGLFKADLHNWNLSHEEVQNATHSDDYGRGGFLPYGFAGTFAGAATCFYAFVGFDCIATTGEEVHNPQKAIPISIVLCLIACFLAYFGVSAVLTLMVPYYDLDINAPLPEAFKYVGWKYAKFVIAAGAICGLSSSLLGAMFPMPRIIYAMASDGLLFRFLSNVSERFHTPVTATLVSGLFAGVFAMLFDLTALIDMMSIGTLLAYTLVAVSVLILRFDESESDTLTIQESLLDTRPVIVRLFRPKTSEPNPFSSQAAKATVFALGVLIALISAMFRFTSHALLTGTWWAVLVTCLLAAAIFLCVFILALQPQSNTTLTFKVPLMPYIPILSMFVNIYLMLNLNDLTWIRFGAWMVVGLIIYFSYGLWHSDERGQGVPYEDLDQLAANIQGDSQGENVWCQGQHISASTASNYEAFSE